jgi:hypothetical protein
MMDLELKFFKNFLQECNGGQAKAITKVVPEHHSITFSRQRHGLPHQQRLGPPNRKVPSFSIFLIIFSITNDSPKS